MLSVHGGRTEAEAGKGKLLQLFAKCRSLPERIQAGIWHLRENTWISFIKERCCLQALLVSHCHMIPQRSPQVPFPCLGQVNAGGAKNFRLSSHFLAFTTDDYLSFVIAFQRTASSNKAVCSSGLVGILHFFKRALLNCSLEMKKMLRDFGIVGPKGFSTLLGLYLLTWAREEPLKFLWFNWKGRQRVRTVRHKREKLHSMLCIWSWQW